MSAGQPPMLVAEEQEPLRRRARFMDEQAEGLGLLIDQQRHGHEPPAPYNGVWPSDDLPSDGHTRPDRYHLGSSRERVAEASIENR